MIGLQISYELHIKMTKQTELPSPMSAPSLEPSPTPEATESARFIPRAQAQEWSGKASYYSREGCLGCHPQMIMRNGEPLDDDRLTLAFNKLPMNSTVKITNVDNGHAVIATVTDTGGFERHGKIADLTIATKDAMKCKSTCNVRIEAQ
jgi:rare lipoprotein A (peptidoglycan hydrolase)